MLPKLKLASNQADMATEQAIVVTGALHMPGLADTQKAHYLVFYLSALDTMSWLLHYNSVTGQRLRAEPHYGGHSCG